MRDMAFIIIEKDTRKRVLWTLSYSEALAEFERLGNENYILGHKWFYI